MKNIFVLIALAFISSGCETVSKNNSQTQAGIANYVVVDYKQISDENIDDYLKIEKFWKPAHRERIKDERMKGWLLFKVINKNNGAYNFITLNVYSDKNMASSGGATKADWENAHGAAVINDQGDSMMALTRKVNNIVRRDHCQNFDLDLYSLTKYRRANFMKVLNGTRDEFVRSRLNFIKPIFERQINDINAPMSGWLMGEVVQSSSTEKDYDFISYDLFKDKIDLTRKNPDVNYAKMAHPDLSTEEINTVNNKNFNMRKMVNREVWELVDYEFGRDGFGGIWSFSDNKYELGKLKNSAPLKIYRDGVFLVLHMKDGVINHLHSGSVEFSGTKMKEKVYASTEGLNDNTTGNEYLFEVDPSPDKFIQLGVKDGEEWREEWKRATKNTYNGSGIEGVWFRKTNNPDNIMVKFILDHSWVWFILNKDTGLIGNSVGGTFEYHNNQYTETVAYHRNVPNYVGGSIQFTLTLKDDRLFLKNERADETWERFVWE